MKNKISVFWVEDNPIIGHMLVEKGVKYPKFIDEDIYEFYLFQHPLEVYEYLDMISLLKERDDLKKSIKISASILPDIIVFDYKMHDNLDARCKYSLYHDYDDHAICMDKHSIVKKLKQTNEVFSKRILFQDRDDVREGNYSLDGFSKTVGLERVETDDEFGLYCGVALVNEFNEYITCGIPATINKAEREQMSYGSIFYEWLHGYNIKNAIDRPNKGGKSWAEILSFAAPLLRTRILAHIVSSRIILNYNQLIKYSSFCHILV